MEPGAVAAFYGVESLVEGAVAAAYVVAKPTTPLRATFERIPINTRLPRSSHSLSIIKGHAYIFGGEIRPREPVDNAVHVYKLPSSTVAEADYNTIPAPASTESAPSPRVGHTAAVISDRIYIFGGRGGKEMQPLEEHGRVWVFDTTSSSWTHLDPAEGLPYPVARSYHASVANEHPLPSKQDHTISPFGTPSIEAYGTVFIHAGCSDTGRLADIWAFDVATRTWSQYPDAPGPARGGPSLTLTQNRLYRFGGFDGKNELGGLDYLELSQTTFDDRGGHGELSTIPESRKWESILAPVDVPAPGSRSIAGLQPITTGAGRNFLLLFLGERDPSSSGHERAGKFWGDVWSYQLHSQGMTGASFKDTARQLVGAKTGEGQWSEVDIPEATMMKGNRPHPGSRAWFASAQVPDLGTGSVALWGGVGEDNEREGDGWILTIDV
ncbi:hypothetical protein MMC06_002892 [Schaereria dolodes]|nr:hypothetical protein [Schaereria dolodes]